MSYVLLLGPQIPPTMRTLKTRQHRLCSPGAADKLWAEMIVMTFTALVNLEEGEEEQEAQEEEEGEEEPEQEEEQEPGGGVLRWCFRSDKRTRCLQLLRSGNYKQQPQ